MRGLTVQALRDVVAWLDSDQDSDAVVSHHGVGTRIGDFHVRIAPGPPYGASGGAVVIFDVRDRERNERDEIVNGIPPEQREAIGALLGQVAPILKAWNGTDRQCVTCSFHIDHEPGEGIRRARANYVPFKAPTKVVTGIALNQIDRSEETC